MNLTLRAPASPDALHDVISNLRGRRAAVVGLGKSGTSAAELLLRLGAGEVICLDDKADHELAATREKMGSLGNAKVVGGGINAEIASQAALVVVSPGVPRRGAWWDAMMSANTVWTGEAELAWRCTSAPWLCITGTNGKSTTTTWLGELVKAAGGKTFVGGNLGDPVCGAAGTRWDHLVVELSSYQCEAISSLDASVAILTNLSPDHIERYKVASAYYDAKMRLFEHQSPQHVAVINAGDPESMARARSIKNARCDFNVKGSDGVEISGRKLILRRGGKVEEYRAGNPAIRGAHNLENAAAAVAAARSAGIPKDAVQNGLDSLQAVKHRLQEIGVINGVLYVNDSKGTNVDATVKALQSFEEPIHLIAGGLDKGTSYDPITSIAKGKVKACYVIGQAAPIIKKAMESVCVVVDCGTLDVALERAKGHAKPGEVVLLSPACASWDQFKNYEHRGDVFAEWVRARTGGTP